MTGPENHARFIAELQAADDDELNPGWMTQAEQSEADRICAAVEKWAFVAVFVLASCMFMACAERWWWCGLLAIGSLAFAGAVARFYRGGWA